MSEQASKFYLHAKKSLGQNFLIDTAVVQEIVNSVNDFLVSKHRTQATIFEIGPGTGALTKALLSECEKNYIVTAVEKDHRAVRGLMDTLVPQYPNNFILHDADILKFSPANFDLCVGNIPYYITSDILMWLCTNKHQFLGAIFMLQDEVADRLCAHTNTKEYSRLSIKMQLNFNMTKLFKVSKECFVPQPKVNSAIVLFESNDFSFLNKHDEREFESFTTLLFSHRRKMLRRIFAENFKLLSAEKVDAFWDALSKIKIAQTDRPESISPHIMLLMFQIMQTLIFQKGIKQ